MTGSKARYSHATPRQGTSHTQAPASQTPFSEQSSAVAQDAIQRAVERGRAGRQSAANSRARSRRTYYSRVVPMSGSTTRLGQKNRQGHVCHIFSELYLDGPCPFPRREKKIQAAECRARRRRKRGRALEPRRRKCAAAAVRSVSSLLAKLRISSRQARGDLARARRQAAISSKDEGLEGPRG